jgi:hypothetical protein
MGYFYETDLGAGRMTSVELDAVARRGGIVGSIPSYGPARPAAIGRLDGGWTARWKKRAGQYVLVLVPANDRARAVAREGRVARYIRAGLSAYHAGKLDAMRISQRDKDSLLPILSYVLKDALLPGAMLAHPSLLAPEYPSKDGYFRSDWLREWEPVLGPGGLGISVRLETLLAQMVKYIVS